MPNTITAVYENGVFVPQTPVHLPEHATVKISLPRLTKKSPGQRFQKLISEPLVVAGIIIPPREERHER